MYVNLIIVMILDNNSFNDHTTLLCLEHASLALTAEGGIKLVFY